MSLAGSRYILKETVDVEESCQHWIYATTISAKLMCGPSFFWWSS